MFSFNLALRLGGGVGEAEEEGRTIPTESNRWTGRREKEDERERGGRGERDEGEEGRKEEEREKRKRRGRRMGKGRVMVGEGRKP